MTSAKRDFTDFHAFGGSVNDAGIYAFPLLRHIDDKKRMRSWQIFARLIKKKKKLTTIDWKLSDEKQVKIDDAYFGIKDDYTDLPSDVIAEIWVETGIVNGKITRSVPSYFETVAHAGNSNQRNPFQQALINARSQYLKRVERGGTKNASGVKRVSATNNKMYFPMLAKAWKDGVKHLVYPAYIQPKLDGVRCIVYLKSKDGGAKNVVVYSRQHKIFPAMNYLQEALYPYLNDLYDQENKQSIYLDGELYVHGKRLQDISGECRNEKKRSANKNVEEDVDDVDANNADDNADDEADDEADDNADDNADDEADDDNADDAEETPVASTDKSQLTNEYHIYDCFYPLELNTSYESRKEQLDVLFNALEDDTAARAVVKPVVTKLVNSEAEAKIEFDKFVAAGYEGAILRNVEGVYLASAEKNGSFLRSKNLVKMKKKFTSEFEIVGCTAGARGNDKGAIIWICRTTSDKPKEFKVTPKDMTKDERRALYIKCKKQPNKYIGKPLTLEYEDLSSAGIPLRAKALVIRNYED